MLSLAFSSTSLLTIRIYLCRNQQKLEAVPLRKSLNLSLPHNEGPHYCEKTPRSDHHFAWFKRDPRQLASYSSCPDSNVLDRCFGTLGRVSWTSSAAGPPSHARAKDELEIFVDLSPLRTWNHGGASRLLLLGNFAVVKDLLYIAVMR